MPNILKKNLVRPIVLIGLMGAGKTTIGKKLAQQLDIPFVDSDQEIEKIAGCSISDIFEQYGETEFRRLEHQVIKRLLETPNIVLATGGGAFIHPETRKLLKQYTTIIWLHCELDIILERIANQTHRPLLNHSNKHEILASLMQKRHPIYAEANFIVQCKQNIHQTVNQIISILKKAQNMRTLSINLSNTNYNVLIGSNLLEQGGAILTSVLAQKKVFIIADQTVAPLHLDKFTHSLTIAHIQHETILIPSGESTKSFHHYEHLITNLLQKGIERKTAIIAFGGGVTGDLSGFAAATTLRGVPFIQIPTTLLSQVDSSVGGKTGINTPVGKNLLGAFYQPKIVIADITTLDTLPQRELQAGYAEIVKAGLIDDPDLFAWCEQYGPKIMKKDHHYLTEAVERACAFKARIIQNDEFEQNNKGRNLLNLGHTLGHTFEAEFGYDGRILHGEAVALGCCLIFKLCTEIGICPQEDTKRVIHHFKSVNLPTSVQDLPTRIKASDLLRHIKHDKKIKDGKILFILVNGIGKTFTTQDVSENILYNLLLKDGCL